MSTFKFVNIFCLLIFSTQYSYGKFMGTTPDGSQNPMTTPPVRDELDGLPLFTNKPTPEPHHQFERTENDLLTTPNDEIPEHADERDRYNIEEDDNLHSNESVLHGTNQTSAVPLEFGNSVSNDTKTTPTSHLSGETTVKSNRAQATTTKSAAEFSAASALLTTAMAMFVFVTMLA